MTSLNTLAKDTKRGDNLGHFAKVKAGWPDHSRTGHFENEIGFFQEFLMKNYFFGAYYLEFDRSGWIALILSEILIKTGMSWPVSSGKFKAPFNKKLKC